METFDKIIGNTTGTSDVSLETAPMSVPDDYAHLNSDVNIVENDEEVIYPIMVREVLPPNFGVASVWVMVAYLVLVVPFTMFFSKLIPSLGEDLGADLSKFDFSSQVFMGVSVLGLIAVGLGVAGLFTAKRSNYSVVPAICGVGLSVLGAVLVAVFLL